MKLDSLCPTNPYVGPVPIPEEGELSGRRQEVEHIRDLLITGRILLLYGPSSAGKTSLIQAGLIPLMRQEAGFELRFVRNLRGGHGGEPGGNRYLESPCHRLATDLSVAQAPAVTLQSCLRDTDPEGKGTGHARELLIIDQLEELFTLDPLDMEAKLAFLEALATALKERNRFALLAIREAHTAKLDHHLHLFPGGLRNRYRLDLLDYAAALEAIGMGGRVPWEPGAPEALLESLWQACIRGLDEPPAPSAPRSGAWVEPVFLQVTCANLWEACRAKEWIGRADVARPDLSVEEAIGAYYANVMADLGRDGRAAERDVREWLEERLITPGGGHGEALRDPVLGWGIADTTLQGLEAAHIVRLEEHAGRSHYELSNDLLIGPIRQENERWRTRIWSPFQIKARRWQQAGRPSFLQLSALECIQAWGWRYLALEPLRPHEADYLRDSTRALVIGRLLPLLVLIALIAGAFVQQQIRQQRLRLEEQSILINLDRAKELASERVVDRALTLGVESAGDVAGLRHGHSADLLEFAARDTLITLLNRFGDIRRLFVAEREVFQAVALDPARDDPLLAYGGMLGQLYIAGLEKPIRRGPIDACPRKGRVHNQIASIVFDPHGRWLATGCESGEIATWSTTDWKEIDRWQAHGGKIWALAVNQDGRLLASESNREDKVKVTLLQEDGRRADPGAGPIELGARPIGKVWSLAFSPRGNRLVVGDGVGALWTCDLDPYLHPDPAEVQCEQTLPGEPHKAAGENDALTAIAFDPSGSRLAIGYWQGGLQLSDPDVSPGSREQIDAGRVPLPVHSMLFAEHEGRSYLVFGRGLRVQYRPVGRGAAEGGPTRRFSSVGNEVYALALHRKTGTLAAATRGGYIAVLDMFGGRDRVCDSIDIAPGNTKPLRAAIVSASRGDVHLLVALPQPGPGGNLALVTLHQGVPQLGPFPTLAAGDDRVLRIAASTATKRVATIEAAGGSDETRAVRLWRLGLASGSAGLEEEWSVSGEQLKDLRPQRVALSPDGTLLVCAFKGSGELLVIPVDEPAAATWIGTGLNWVREIAFSPDGRNFVAGGYPEVPREDTPTDRVFVWRAGPRGLTARDGEPMYLSRLASRVKELAIATNAEGTAFVVAGAEYGQIDVWHLESGRLAQTLRADSRSIYQLAFEPGASLLAATDDHGVVRLWSTAQWSLDGRRWDGPMRLSTWTDEIGKPGFLAFAPGGGWLASTTGDLDIWDLDLDSLLRKTRSILRDLGEHGADSQFRGKVGTFVREPLEAAVRGR